MGLLDDKSMDLVLDRAALCMTILEESPLCGEHAGLVEFGVAFLVGSLAVDNGTSGMSNKDIAQAGKDMIIGYVARVYGEVEQERERRGE